MGAIFFTCSLIDPPATSPSQDILFRYPTYFSFSISHKNMSPVEAIDSECSEPSLNTEPRSEHGPSSRSKRPSARSLILRWPTKLDYGSSSRYWGRPTGFIHRPWLFVTRLSVRMSSQVLAKFLEEKKKAKNWGRESTSEVFFMPCFLSPQPK